MSPNKYTLANANIFRKTVLISVRAFIFRKWDVFLQWAYRSFESCIGSFLTFHRRPLRATDIGLRPDAIYKSRKIAIVIQGPLVHHCDFTLETVRLYKQLFPSCVIILSTWDDEDATTVEKIRSEKIIILLSKKPDVAGISNINYQIVSTINGIREAQKQGAEYVLKTRADQRIYAPNTDEFLWSLLKCFPLEQTDVQRERIIALSSNTFKYRPYSISDMFLFGGIQDMMLYWDVPLDPRMGISMDSSSVRSWVGLGLCELYLSLAFLTKIGHQTQQTIADGWDVYARYFCIIDTVSVDLYWYKYYRQREYRRLGYANIKNDDELSFRDWLILYTSSANKQPPPEATLQTPFTSKIL